MNKLNDFFNSPNREKLLKEVARKSSEDQLGYNKEDELYFGNPIPEDNRANFGMGLLILAVGIAIIILVV